MKFTILKGWHYAIFNPLRFGWVKFNCNEVRFKFTLPKSAWYAKENEDDADWNKLYGISYGFFGMHKNSMRFVWRPDFEVKYRFELGYYAYEDGKRVVKKLCSVYADAQYEGQLCLHDDNFVSAYVNQDYRYFENSGIKRSWIGFGCRPYHGGNNVSKNKYIITVKEN